MKPADRSNDPKFEMSRKVAGLLLLYAIISVILVKLLAELAFAGSSSF